VRGLLGRGVGKCECLRDDLAIHEESGGFTGCRFCATKSGRRQITDHNGGVITSDDSPGVSLLRSDGDSELRALPVATVARAPGQ
jgi:hypothetical protein